MLPKPLFQAGCRLFVSAAATAASFFLLAAGSHGQPGLDAPEAIGPFLNGNFPAVESTSASEWRVQESYTGININLPMHLAPYPGTTKLLCVAKEGRIFLFEDHPAAIATETFLDLRSQTFSNNDSGMTWLVFHPSFGVAGNPNRGHVYVTYKWAPPGGNGNEAFWRLSRFTVPDGTQAADPGSETILIQQYDRQQWHDSGCMAFIPDPVTGHPFLHIAVGDEGGANDQYNVAQKINQRLFSGILRIDVDQDLSRSHPIRRQPTPPPAGEQQPPAGWPASFTANYTIPANNPFLDAAGAQLEEFYAIGLRQPYRFSHDPASGRTWIGESGQDTEEEVSILAAGANYGWPIREGAATGPKPAVPITHGTLTEPVWTANHSAGPDGCVVGGFVYRGTSFPDLVGKYLTVDNVSGRIRALTTGASAATAAILAEMPSGSVYSGTSTIGRDHAGEPVFIKINNVANRGRFMKLAVVPPVSSQPVWYRFEDQDGGNSSGYVADNPGNTTADSIDGAIPLAAYDDEANTSSNTRYAGSNGLVPAGQTANLAGIRTALGDGDGRPGNRNGDLTMPREFGRLDDFTLELSFNPATGSLGSGSYQCFLGLDGTTGIIPEGGEYGPPIQPFRLMRWGRNDANSNPGVPLENGDLFLNLRTLDPATQQWRSVAIHVLDRTLFTANQWYHLAIVGNVATGTVTVYRHENGGYTQLGQGTGYVGNLSSSLWSLGRGMYGGNSADWVTDARFDEVRIATTALAPEQFLYASQPWNPVIVATEPPLLLSATGAFSDLATLTPASGVVPYTVNSPLWSDAAAKRRWIALPNDGSHDTPAEKIGFAPEGDWSFPPGTVFIKHFELPTDDNNPSVVKRLETRFIVMPTTGEPYGVTYKWRADGTDAELLPGGLSEPVTITEAGGGTRTQNWDYPSRTDCRICHNGNAGHVLGLKTHQLNGDLTYPRTGRTANQLETLAGIGWFDAGYRPEHLPWFLKSRAMTDSSASLQERVRSYLDSNCAQCHRPGGVRAYFDARFTTPIHSQGLIRGELEAPYFDPGDRVIVPGDLARSILRVRHGTTGILKMPPLAKNRVDEQAAQVISDWILSLPAGPGVTLEAPASAGGPFEVDIHFSEPVTGLTAADFSIRGGTPGNLSGSGWIYVLTVLPDGFGELRVSLPGGTAQGSGGQGNFASAESRVIVSDASLMAWLKLDDGTGLSAIDSSPQETHGTLVGMEETDWTAGKFGGALRFDNSDERVTLANVAPGDFTLSFWLRTTRTFPVTDFLPAGLAVATADSPGANKDFLIAGTQGGGVNRISFQTGHANGSPNSVLHGITPVNTGDWVHVALTRVQATGEMKIYVNGALDATRTGSLDPLDANPVLSLGGNPGNAAASFEGDIDQFRIHGRSLSASEIQQLHGESDAVPPYDAWLAEWLPGLSHLHDLDLDPEKDGTPNFGEFAFGGDPLSPSVFPIPLERTADGSVTLSFTARKAPAGAVYEVQVGDNLGTWADADPDITNVTRVDFPGTGYERVTITYLPPVAAGKLFFRIQALPE